MNLTTKFLEHKQFKDVYNIAIKYLMDKYGYKTHVLSKSIQDQLRKARNKKERKEIENKIKDSDYIHLMDSSKIEDHDDKEIYLLLNQFYLSNKVKIELENKLKTMGIIPD